MRENSQGTRSTSCLSSVRIPNGGGGEMGYSFGYCFVGGGEEGENFIPRLYLEAHTTYTGVYHTDLVLTRFLLCLAFREREKVVILTPNNRPKSLKTLNPVKARYSTHSLWVTLLGGQFT